jgi:hypothetical protein
MLSYGTLDEAEADCEIQRCLLAALGASKRSLRRDECGTWRITGRNGHVYTWGQSGGWLLFCDAGNCDAGSSRKWAAIKRRLSFCKVTQDGDTEGCLRLFDLPTPEQAVAIRKALGLRRKRAANAGSYSGIELASAKTGVSGAPASEKGKGGVIAHPRRLEQKMRHNPKVTEPAE